MPYVLPAAAASAYAPTAITSQVEPEQLSLADFSALLKDTKYIQHGLVRTDLTEADRALRLPYMIVHNPASHQFLRIELDADEKTDLVTVLTGLAEGGTQRDVLVGKQLSIKYFSSLDDAQRSRVPVTKVVTLEQETEPQADMGLFIDANHFNPRMHMAITLDKVDDGY